MKHVTLFFGSFNPVHKGHIALAESVLEQGLAEEVWFVLSPQSPFKTDYDFWPEEKRAGLLKNALDRRNAAHAEGPGKMFFCDAELHLPKPSYTVQTLQYLQETYPQHIFSILMGEDNLEGLHKWKNYNEVIEGVEKIFVYPRSKAGAEGNGDVGAPGRVAEGYPVQAEFPQKFEYIKCPLLDISSSRIRAMMAEGLDVSGLVP